MFVYAHSVTEFYVCLGSRWLIGFVDWFDRRFMTWVWMSWGDLCGWQDIKTPITATTTVPTDKPDGFCGRNWSNWHWLKRKAAERPEPPWGSELRQWRSTSDTEEPGRPRLSVRPNYKPQPLSSISVDVTDWSNIFQKKKKASVPELSGTEFRASGAVPVRVAEVADLAGSRPQ